MLFAQLMLVAAAVQVSPPLPVDWSALPRAELTRPSEITPDATDYVVRLHRSRRCPIGRLRTGWRGVTVQIALLVAPDGTLLRVVAEQGHCTDLRAYAVALIIRHYRGKIAAPGGNAPAWQRTSLGFSWQG